MSERRYGHQLLIAIDQLLNTLAAGWADETLSSRAWRCRDVRKWAIAYRAIDAVFFWQPNHCQNAYEYERMQGQLPEGFRE
uniref:hypothetical protein n=1 Tax=Castellaniella defragrans TaxID=75697 RepID=UPI0033412D81